jgi:acyl-CoA synthetase (NDP forming)
MTRSWYGALVDPASVAIVGASNDPDKTSGRTLRFLQEYGYRGRIHPINPSRDVVQGLAAFDALASVDDVIDLAIITTPAAAAVEAVAECVRLEVPAVIVIPSGFAELDDEGAQLQQRMLEQVRGSATRVLGPNCIGMLGVRNRVTATMDTGLDQPGLELRDGGCAFVTQSGAIGSYVFNVAQSQGIGMNAWISTGNEMDLSFSEVLRALIEDPDVAGVCGYLEGVRDADGFLDALHRAQELGKPLALMKAGRSDVGSAAVGSHTGALAGVDRVHQGVFDQFGVTRLDTIDDVVGWMQLVDHPVAGRRLSVVTVSGGYGALAADRCADLGLEFADWGGTWQDELASALPSYVAARNPIDMTGAIADRGLFEGVLRLADRHPGTDLTLVLLGNLYRAKDGLVAALTEVAASTPTPIVVVWTGGADDARRALTTGGVPAYAELDDALLAIARHQTAERAPTAAVAPPARPTTEARGMLSAARDRGARMLDEAESKRLLALYGLPTIDEVVAEDPDRAADAAEALGYPVALKVLSDRVVHKSELGGVVLGLADRDEVEDAARRMSERLEGSLDGGVRFVVQRMAPPGVELLLGVAQDPVFGPVLAIGLGGHLAELLEDVALRLPPLRGGDIDLALGSLRFSALLGDFRGSGRRDLDAVRGAVEGLSALTEDLGDLVASIDINPLIVGREGEGAWVVDAVVLLPGADEPAHGTRETS